ncbi:MAG: hypothetical protein ABR608_14940 [Pseudonocardiaceae bacterium]
MLRRHLIPPPDEPPLQVVLTCGDRECRHTFEPDLIAFATGRLACPVCSGWTFQATLAEPDAPASGGED